MKKPVAKTTGFSFLKRLSLYNCSAGLPALCGYKLIS